MKTMKECRQQPSVLPALFFCFALRDYNDVTVFPIFIVTLQS